MNLAIVGSRTFGDVLTDRRIRKQVFDYVATLPKDTIIISGGASGVDTWAEGAAREHGLAVIVYKPDWKAYGKSAGFIRNRQIVTEADAVVAFWSGSKGTAHSLRLAIQQNKNIRVFNGQGQEIEECVAKDMLNESA